MVLFPTDPSGMLGSMVDGPVNRVLRDVLLGLLREQWSSMTFGELEQLLASPVGQTLRPLRITAVTREARRTSKLRRAFERLEREITSLVLPGCAKVKGRRLVPKLLHIFIQLVENGCSDLAGLTGDVIRQIDERVPGMGLVSESMSDALRVLATSSCGLVVRPTPRTWRVRLAELGQPQSPFYKQFCSDLSGKVVSDVVRPLRSTSTTPPRAGGGHQAVRAPGRRRQRETR